MLDKEPLSILQYNVNKSRTRVTIPLFESDGIINYDILVIQEPWKNPFQATTNNRVSQYFDLYC